MHNNIIQPTILELCICLCLERSLLRPKWLVSTYLEVVLAEDGFKVVCRVVEL